MSYQVSKWKIILILIEREHTSGPREMLPPKSKSTESGTPVESRRNTELTFTFSFLILPLQLAFALEMNDHHFVQRTFRLDCDP